MLANKSILIFTCFSTKHENFANDLRFGHLLAELKALDIPYRELRGCWRGLVERSVAVSEEYREMVESWCSLYKQEAYFEVSGSVGAQVAESVWPDGSRLFCGAWREVTKAEAEAEPGYTYDLGADKYYIAKKGI